MNENQRKIRISKVLRLNCKYLIDDSDQEMMIEDYI